MFAGFWQSTAARCLEDGVSDYAGDAGRRHLLPCLHVLSVRKVNNVLTYLQAHNESWVQWIAHVVFQHC